MQRIVEWMPCPGDLSNEKVRGMALCSDCRKQFGREVGDAVLEGEAPPTYEEWIERRVSGLMPALEEAVKTTVGALYTVKAQKEERLNEMLHEAVARRQLTVDQLRAARERLHETKGREVWDALSGNKIFRQNKVAEARLTEARRLLKDLEAKKPVPPAPDDEPAAAPAPSPSRQKAKGTKAKAEKGTKTKRVKEAREREASEIE